jgi:FlaA1/EpsC-like NDP-sugar epimerase
MVRETVWFRQRKKVKSSRSPMQPNLHHYLAAFGRLVLLLLAYGAVLFISLLGSFLLRFDFHVPAEFWPRFWLSVVWMVPLKLALLGFFGQYRSLLTFFSLPDAKMLAWAMGLAALVSFAAWFITQGEDVVPRGVIVTDTLLSFLGLAVLRTALRVYRERVIGVGSLSGGHRRRTAIMGSGPSAALLLRDIQSRPGLGLEVVCFVEDDRRKIGNTLHGIPVIGPRSRLEKLAEALGLQKVIIAMPGARPGEIKEIVAELNALGLEHDILPSVAEMLDGEVTVSRLRPVDPVDLLGREEASLDEKGITEMLGGQVVMVTGAGGSIGSELCRQVAARHPAKIVLVERSEPALFAIEQELRERFPHVNLVARAFDVCDEVPMAQLFAAWTPRLVFHSAAHKHVPLMEEQPAEALRNNVLGTEVTARLAGRHGARKFVLISSDKAVNPASVMGATKRLAELVVDEIRRAPGHCCAYSAVRFGNVLGSSGSVVPIFRRQIAAGGPVTVTHPEATRFFMSLTEAVGLILQSAWQAEGGEIFVLEMGVATKIDDLARQMIELSGFEPGVDIKITYTGLRPGEKLHEEPIHATESVVRTVHPKVLHLRNGRAEHPRPPALELRALLRESPAHEEELRAWLRRQASHYGAESPTISG